MNTRTPTFKSLRKDAFAVESRVQILLEFGFALDLAELILQTDPADARMIAFAKQLQNIEEKAPSTREF